MSSCFFTVIWTVVNQKWRKRVEGKEEKKKIVIFFFVFRKKNIKDSKFIYDESLLIYKFDFNECQTVWNAYMYWIDERGNDITNHKNW
jgi:hypothetical protein